MMMQLEHVRLMHKQDETIRQQELVCQQEGAYYQSKIQRLQVKLEELRVRDVGPNSRGPPDVEDDDNDNDDEDEAES